MRQGQQGIRRHVRRAAALALLLALVPAPARAAGGDLDPTFGDAGKVVTTYPNGAAANEVAIQPDGKIVVAGGSMAGSPSLATCPAARSTPSSAPTAS